MHVTTLPQAQTPQQDVEPRKVATRLEVCHSIILLGDISNQHLLNVRSSILKNCQTMICVIPAAVLAVPCP